MVEVVFYEHRPSFGQTLNVPWSGICLGAAESLISVGLSLNFPKGYLARSVISRRDYRLIKPKLWVGIDHPLFLLCTGNRRISPSGLVIANSTPQGTPRSFAGSLKTGTTFFLIDKKDIND